MDKSTAQAIVDQARNLHIDAKIDPTSFPRVYWVILEQPNGKEKVITQKKDWDRYRAEAQVSR
jgi:hypothetical protein